MVKIRVTFQIEKAGKVSYQQDYYSTKISLSEKEYSQVFSSSVPFALRATRTDLISQEERINKVIGERPGITPALLESILTGKMVVVNERPVTLEVAKLFEGAISKCKTVATAKNYTDALKSFLRYSGPGLLLDQITAEWVDGYVTFARSPYTDQNGITRKCGNTTIAMYLRCLRAVFNDAIDRKIISRDLYPFTKHGYVIRSEKTVKHALNETQKASFINVRVEHPQERKNLLYWFFSYYCLGMNFQDMAFLRPEDIRPEVIVYVRRKTMNTVKTIKPIIVPLRAEVRQILAELGGHKPYVFGIIDDTMDEKTKHRKIEQWYRTVNKWVNRVAKRIGIPFKVNTYNARHTMAKQLIEKGAHLQDVQELLGHTTILTTQVYTMGMDIDKAKELSDKL